MPSKMSASEISRLQSMSLNDLYGELGRALIVAEFPRKAPIEKSVAIDRGRAFLDTSLEKLRAKICVDWRYCNKRSDYGNFQTLVYAIAPLVSTVVGVPASTALIVAVILTRIGLDDLCKCPNQ